MTSSTIRELLKDFRCWYLILTAGLFLVVFGGIYIIYYRFLHPLSNYPGPFWASTTNIYKAYHLWTLHLPEKLVHLHEQYGDVVRVGPNDLSFRTESAYGMIYKAGRSLPKTKFYDGFTAFNPNLFGTQDEMIHAIRRRQMAHAFSLQSVKEMEPFIEKHIGLLRQNLDSAADSGAVVDLKELIAFYVLDVLGDLAFCRSFESQKEQIPEKLPPINDHIYLACLLGQLPDVLPVLKKICQNMPFPWFQRLFEARRKLVELTADCVRTRMNAKSEGRKDLLTCLINAVDSDTGAKLTELDINTEAFAMVVAGSHTTSGTLTLLFAHLLQNPSILNKVVAELDEKLPGGVDVSYPIEGLEQILTYTMACIQENFRINPVFTMPLTREVAIPGGMSIDGHHIPQGTTVFASNHVLHHAPVIWGSNHNVYDPERFLSSNADYYKRHLVPFSIGHRMCIGRNIAMTNILKVTATVLKFYQIEMVNPAQKITTLSVGISEKEGPLMVKIRRRKTFENTV